MLRGWAECHYGLLYACMVWVWRFVFSVAVATAMLGFLVLVLNRGVSLVALLYLMAIAAAVIYPVSTRAGSGLTPST